MTVEKLFNHFQICKKCKFYEGKAGKPMTLVVGVCQRNHRYFWNCKYIITLENFDKSCPYYLEHILYIR